MDSIVAFKTLGFADAGFKLDKTATELQVKSAFIRFRDVNNLDSYMEFFTKDTDYSLILPIKLTMYLDHGYNSLYGTDKISIAKLTYGEDDISEGIFMDSSLDLTKASTLLLAEKVDNGEMGVSSGACSHLVRYQSCTDEATGAYGYKILNWPIGEGSYTTRPADKDNIVIPEKMDVGKVISYSQKYDLSEVPKILTGKEEVKQKKDEQTIEEIDYSKGNQYVQDLLVRIGRQ